MGWTIAGKIFAGNALDGGDVMPGEILRARLDRMPIREARGVR